MTLPTPYAEVIGDPIYHSKSPIIHNFWLEKRHINAEYRATRVRPTDLAAYVETRRADPLWRGCNVTIPHKQPMLPLVDSPLRTAARVGAVNCVYRARTGLGGENSDVEGVLEAIGFTASEREPGITCLIGAGGAARAALYALETAGMTELRILVRRPERAQDLIDAFGITASIHRFVDARAALSGATTVINASPLGMTGQQRMPVAVIEALELAAADALVFDMVYAPLETDLLAEATRLGLAAVDGLTMLIGQADLAFELFFHQPAPREHDAELRTILTT